MAWTLHRLGAGHLAHHVDVMHAAIDDRREALQQPLVPSPGLAVRLLIEVHAEHERRAELTRDLDEPDPRGMLAQDVADDELALRALRGLDDLLGVGDIVGERLLDEHMRARLHRLDGEIGVGVRQRIDRDDVGLQFGQRLLEVGELLRVRERRRQFAVSNPPLADTDHLVTRNAGITERVAHPHIAKSDDKNSLGHLFASPSVFSSPLSCPRKRSIQESTSKDKGLRRLSGPSL